MKKSISFNLEEDIIEKIEQYQKEKRLSSRSAALERIILSMDHININNMLEIFKNTLQNNNIDTQVKKEDVIVEEPLKEEIKNNKIENSVNDIFSSMPQD
ncbi:hypothetical protein [Clostridium haemolyticum]|uniref:Ribbon-helix-helix protein CopG domain-containing protein n=1 Tax=Clostridium haemolyticum NCTC 9693 TaxID=1443114 RepID=A0ABR4TGV0_CLOHA|nr:hypothetical protein [Clostridium haemolyticum]KEI18233.1 hypothetical protein Z960_03660 [Clostridium haemolyticum NCTC 9693]KGN03868.1 hypothetical protein Z961_06075 [Clostridium haemolyticum NCTC 8350]